MMIGYLNYLDSSLRGKRLKGNGREIRRETACVGEVRKGTRSTSSFLERPSCFSCAQNPLFLPFQRPQAG